MIQVNGHFLVKEVFSLESGKTSDCRRLELQGKRASEEARRVLKLFL